MATAPTLYWYQLDTGTLMPAYFGQLDAAVAELCSENGVTAPTAKWWNPTACRLVSTWQLQIDTAVRALCTALAVAEPIPLILGSNTGQYQSKYAESLDGVVRELCASYHADAVHFAAASFLESASLTATDNAFFSFAMWMKIQAADVQGAGFFSSADSLAYLFGDGGGLDWQLSNTARDKFVRLQAPSTIPDNQWRCFIGSADTQNGICKLYRGDTDISTALTENDSPFNNDPNGENFFALSFAVGDYADVRIIPGVSLLTAGDIPEATRRLFINASGKPVDPEVATAALGAAGAMLFSGDATAFLVNQGTGGAFTLTGAVTNASTSPSD